MRILFVEHCVDCTWNAAWIVALDCDVDLEKCVFTNIFPYVATYFCAKNLAWFYKKVVKDQCHVAG